MKKILGIYSAPRGHWVGDGFPVRTLFSYQTQAQHLSPFLMLDYAGPHTFTPASKPRGVGQHPHRGFETVTIVYKGEVEHKDSTGGGGKIGPGDVQWMTAGAGILHEEFHSDAFTRNGGEFEVVQLWVNLPAADKSAPAAYQTLLNQDIPVVDLPDEAGQVRVIAGEFEAGKGPAHTFTPMNVWDVRLAQGKSASFSIPDGHTAAIVMLHGTVQVNDNGIAREAQLVVLDRSGDTVHIEANNDVSFLILSGEPIEEPIVGSGPFVMNSEAEIRQAIDDFNSGSFGKMPAVTA